MQKYRNKRISHSNKVVRVPKKISKAALKLMRFDSPRSYANSAISYLFETRLTLFEWELHFINSKKGILLSSFVTHSLLGSLAAQAELGDAPKIYGLVMHSNISHPISGQT